VDTVLHNVACVRSWKAPCDDHLKAISKYDEKIARFEEILKQMKTDLYGSIEAIAEKVTRSAATVDPPNVGSRKLSAIYSWLRHVQSLAKKWKFPRRTN